MSFDIIKKFEAEIAEFYGAPYAVGVDSCTHALELCLRYIAPKKIEIPTHTYLSVAFLGEKLGIEWEWKEDEWSNYYYIGNTNIKLNIFEPNTFPITISQCPFLINIIVDTSSGNEVPNATANKDKKVVDKPKN